MIQEFHLFAGIGGGIYGGELLGHTCCAGVEIMDYAQRVLKQRQEDGWMPKFPIYRDLCQLHGQEFRGKFDVLCGGFPCQAFSTAAHGKNIAAKNLWGEMFRFAQESNAPIIFGENVVLRAIEKARLDLERVGYRVERIRLSCADIGADHRRNRFWLLAVKNDSVGRKVFNRLAKHVESLPKLTGWCWSQSPDRIGSAVEIDKKDRRDQLLGVGNAQSPFVAATAFRILVNRHLAHFGVGREIVDAAELTKVFEKRKTWITKKFRESKDPRKHIEGLVHTPTTMANYCCASMEKHEGCRNYQTVFCNPRPGTPRRPEPVEAEYLMGFPLGASSPNPLKKDNLERWKQMSHK